MELEKLEVILKLLKETNTIGANVEEFLETDKRLVYLFTLYTNPKTWGDAQKEQDNFLEILQSIIPNIEFIIEELIYYKTKNK